MLLPMHSAHVQDHAHHGHKHVHDSRVSSVGIECDGEQKATAESRGGASSTRGTERRAAWAAWQTLHCFFGGPCAGSALQLAGGLHAAMMRSTLPRFSAGALDMQRLNEWLSTLLQVGGALAAGQQGSPHGSPAQGGATSAQRRSHWRGHLEGTCAMRPIWLSMFLLWHPSCS